MICPSCGFDSSTKKQANFTPLIQALMSKRSKSTNNVLGNIFKTIKEYHPLAVKTIYFFLRDIEDVEDRVVRFSIGQYYKSEKYTDKNIHYLKAMILNYGKDSSKLKDTEKKIYGGKPPVREVINE